MSRTIAKRCVLLGVLLFTGGTGACSSPARSPLSQAPDETALGDSIRMLVDEFLAASERLEFPVDRVDSALTWYTHGARLTGAELIAAQDGNANAIRESRSVLVGEPDIRVLGPDAALAAYRVTETLVDTAGAEFVFPHAVTQVWVRGEDGWRLAHAHVSSNGGE